MPIKNKHKRERRALCGICPAGCWVIVSYNDQGRIDKVRADESSNFGVICKLVAADPVRPENNYFYRLAPYSHS